jgi:NAD(P)H-dependent flavin oxidoreductase YrpB (nitropropane dioxygenase family)
MKTRFHHRTVRHRRSPASREHPIIQGGMHYVGFAELAAAVSNARRARHHHRPDAAHARTAREGNRPLPRHDRQAVRREPDLPARVNHARLSGLHQGDHRRRREGVETAGNNPVQVLPALKENGIKVIHKCTAVRHSLKARRSAATRSAVDGFECGGHPGEDDMPN